jgi:DNA repair protein RadD
MPMPDRRRPQLRPYQIDDIERIDRAFERGYRRVLYQAPTGSGKTVLFTAMVHDAIRYGERTVIVGHRDEIVQQVSRALDTLGVRHGVIAAGYDEHRSRAVQVASAMTLVRRLDRLDADWLILDEAHHARASTWKQIIEAASEARIFGCTATPRRLDGKGLDDIFEYLIVGPTVIDLIDDGYLAPYTLYAPEFEPDLSGVSTRAGDYVTGQLANVMSRPVVIGSAVDEYEDRCDGSPALVFCVDIAHSKLVAERFAQRGYRAEHVDGDTPRLERRRLIRQLERGDIDVLCNCGLVSEGLDVPGVEAVILLRPTQSLALYLQQVGRALRPAPGKDGAIILDHAGNVHRHGLPCARRRWSLTGHANQVHPGIRRCPECGAINDVHAKHCTACGSVLYQPQIVEQIEVPSDALVEIDRLQEMSYSEVLEWAGSSRDRLERVRIARGYKPGWVWHIMQAARQTRQDDDDDDDD